MPLAQSKNEQPQSSAVGRRLGWWGRTLAVAGALALVPQLHAGFNQTGAGPYDYNNTANWVGGTINGTWDSSLTLGAAQTVTFAADTVLTTGLTFNYAGNYGLTFTSTNSTARTLTLGGDIGLNTGGGTSANATLGSGSNPLNLNLGGVPRTITVAANRTLTISNALSNGSITNAGAGTLTLAGANTYTGTTAVNGGTLNLAGNEAAATGSLLVNINASAAATVNIATGAVVTVASGNKIQAGNNTTSGSSSQTVNVSGWVTNNGTLYVGRPGTVNLNSGAVWVQGGAAYGAVTIAGLGGYQAAMNVNAGAIFTYTGTGGNYIAINPAYNSSGSGSLTINGGTFVTGSYFQNQIPLPSSGAANIVLNNGGILRLSASVPQLFQTVGATNVFQVGAGGGVIDTAGYATTLATGISGTGSLTKAGAGTLTLTGANTYTNNTFINGGTLALSGSALINNSPGIVVASNAIFNVSGLSSPFTLAQALSSQTLSNSAPGAIINGTNNCSAGTISLVYDGVNPSFILTNGGMTLSASTILKINNTGAALGTGSYLIISNITAGTAGVVAGTLPPVTLSGNMFTNTTASLSINSSGLNLNLVVRTAGEEPLHWAGSGTGNWDINDAANMIWKDSLTPANAVYYVDGDQVSFDEAYISGNQVVTLNTVATPGSMVVSNNTYNYTISGSGGIAGAIGLTKSGSAALTLATANTYTGTTAVNGGTLNLAGNEAAATGSLLVNINASAAATVNIATGAVVTVASGNKIQAGNNTTSGSSSQTVNVSGWVTNNGTLYVGRPGTVNLNSGAVWVQGGAAYGAVTIAGLGGYQAAMNVNAGAIFTYTGTGGNYIAINPAYNSSGSGSLTINGGTFVTGSYFQNQIPLPSSGAANIVLNNGGILRLSASVPQLFQTVGATNVFQVGAGGGVIDTAGYATTLATGISGTGSLTKAGAGTLTLTGANTYTNNTFINGGTLALSGSALINNSPGIVVASNAIFNVSGLSSPFTLAQALSSQTLSNSAPGAIINGTNNCSAGTISLVYDGVNPSFILTNGGMTLSGSTTFKVTKSGGALPVGVYKIISKAAGGTAGLVAGTAPNSVTIANGASTGTLGLSSGELYLTNGSVSTWSYSSSSFTYNGAAQTPTITLSGSTGSKTTNYVGTTVTYNSVNAPTNAGAYYVSNTVVADANYLGATNTQSFTIGQATPVVTVTAGSYIYSGSAQGPNSFTTSPAGDSGAATWSYVGVSGTTYGPNANAPTNAGNYTATVSLAADSTFNAASSSAKAFTINQTSTSVGATSTNNPCGYKDAVAFHATLPADATGSVVFSTTNGPISTNTLSSGNATSLSITNLPRGTNLITVAYLGDGNYLGSSTNLEQIVTNHPPMLAPLDLTRTAGLGLHFPWSQLTNQWTDADGDAVTLTTFNLSTTNSVSLLTNATLIGYPASAPNVADQINYTASDSYGDTVAGVINILVNAYVTGTNSIVHLTTGNPTTLKAYGIIGFSYITERSTNLTDWASIATNTVSTNGVISVSDSFSDLGGTPPGSAYYRIKWQP